MQDSVSSRWLSVVALAASLSVLWRVLSFAGTPDALTNLSVCRNGWPSCERSRLTLVEVTQVALAAPRILRSLAADAFRSSLDSAGGP